MKNNIELVNVDSIHLKYNIEDSIYDDNKLIKTLSEELSDISIYCNNNSQNKSIRRRSNSNSENTIKSTIQESIIIKKENMKNKQTSIWNNFKNKMKNIKNKIKYNTFNFNTNFNFLNFTQINLYDNIYNKKDDLEKFCEDFYNIIYFSYRSNITPIFNKQNNKKYTSDCGWGCIIRAAQMILSRGIQNIKILKYKNYNLEEKIEKIKETLILFMDCDLSDKNTFSIQNICKIGESFQKYPGEWFSDISIIQIFQNLNEKFLPIKNLNIFHFTDGIIFQNEIIKKCKEIDKFHSGLIFMSFRLGIEKISNIYFPLIKAIFDIPQNLGIIGGKQNDAHYFIGKAENYLLYLDPHLNQNCINSIEELNYDFSSYLKKQIYQTHIKNISPSFTIGFYFTNFEEFETLITNLILFAGKENSFIKVKFDSDLNFNDNKLDKYNISSIKDDF